ncbi:MAG: DUF1501 domain-containing protein [Nevskia sp.]|nr:DUF1501 domain-containing protein [Nevskia sp.]
MDRRTLLKSLASAGAAGLLPLSRSGWAAVTDGGPGPRLIVVMLRGAVDGLNLVVPCADGNYYRLRGSIAVPRPGQDKGALDLDGRFGLHPALAPLLPLWQSHQLAFVHAAGSPDPTRSHFDAQDYMESGTPGVKRTGDGWMNRLLGQLAPTPGSLNAVSLGPVLPRIFSGTNNVANIPLGRDAAKPTAMDRPEISAAYDRMYSNAGELGAAYREGRESREHVLSDLSSDPVSPESMQADHGAPPPQGFALDAAQLATLIRRNPGLRLSFMQLGGWDTHVNQGGSEGQLANRLKPLAEGLATLSTQLGPAWNDTVVVVMSEFGRTAHQNGTGGTDHGHGNVMWVLGGRVHGGKVYGDWPGLDDAALYERRDLAVTTDFRSVLRQVCERHLKLTDRQLAAVFPQAPSTGKAALAQLI